MNFNSRISIHKALGAHCAVYHMLDLIYHHIYYCNTNYAET